MSYIHFCMCAYMCIYGYVSVCTCMYATAGKLDFSYLVTILKCQDLANCYAIDIQHIFMEFNFLYISNHYYCFFYLQNNYSNPLAFVIWAFMRLWGYLTGNNLISHTTKLFCGCKLLN